MFLSEVRKLKIFLSFIRHKRDSWFVLSLPDADVEVEGVPVAPLDVCCHDANKDYVVVTWKQPAVEGSSSILGYYIDRWIQRTEASRHRALPR